MCGISGWVAPPGEALDAAAARAMRDVLRHRGPDGAGEWVAPAGDGGPAAGLGHRRLRIIDLTDAAAQPMVSDDGRVALTYNGEVYNFAALRSELRAAGARFDSTGDTEVVLRAYEHWGEAGIERLDGMFALAIWDGRRGRLVLARDRTGKKPLYYWTDGRRLAFGSEIKALLACPWVPRERDDARLAEFLTFGYVPTPATLYRGIAQVPPASIVAFDRDGLAPPRRYWDPLASPGREHGPLHEDVRRLLREAVERRLVADVPLGALLSGGIDSSLVAALMGEASGEPPYTFSIGFPEQASFDERRYARQVAEHLGTRHTEFAVRLDAVGLLDRLVWHHDQPFMDSSAIPTFVVAELAAQRVAVALNGDGGDEVFGGYERFRAAALAFRLPAGAALAARNLGPRVPSAHARRAARFLAQADRSVTDRYRSWISVVDRSLLPDLLAPDVLAAAAGPAEASMEAAYATAGHLPALDRILYANFTTYLPDDLAVKMDRMAMANSLETRSPFLDTALIERLAAVPARRKVGLRRLKPVLRRACWDLLPPEIWNRRKQGFGVPMGLWFRGPLGDMFADEVLASDARVAPLLQPATVAKMYAEQRSGRFEHGHRLWTILTLERWLRALERPPAPEPPASQVEVRGIPSPRWRQTPLPRGAS